MKNRGFSIIELVVTTGIIAIITAMVFAGYRQMGTGPLLDDEVDTVISGIEDARSTALSATQVLDEDDQQVEYFTITIEEPGYILFANTDKETSYLYERNIRVVEGDGRAIGFKPPEPEVIFLDRDLETEILEDEDHIEFEFNYGDDRGEDNVVVRVNRAGLVKVVSDND